MTRTYTFKDITNCNMCGSNVAGHKVLGKRLNRSQGRRPASRTGITTTTVVRCTECGLIYSNPQPIPNNIQDHYGVPPEAYWKKEYFQPDEKYFQYEIKTLKSLGSFAPGAKALDIGAGLGKCMIALENAGFDVFGIEPSEPFYRRAIDKMNIDPSKLQLSAIESASFPENQFDFITFGAVLEHLYDPSASIKKAMRWLKPGGILHIEVPSSNWLVARLINLYYAVRGLDYVSNISPMHEPFHLYEFTLESFLRNSGNGGYELLHHEYYVAQTFLPRVLDFILVPFMKHTRTGMQLCVWLKKSNP